MFKAHALKLKCSNENCDGIQYFKIEPEYFPTISRDINYWRKDALCDKCIDKERERRTQEFKEFLKFNDEKLLNPSE